MKFLSDHGKSKSILSEWAMAEKKTIVCASFYFWNSGFPMERTQQGLLQSLLFQILRKCPHLIPDIFPDRWNADELSHRYPKPWTRVELSSALARILGLPERQMSARFCFFIDGLDEYEGDRHQLVTDLKTLSRSRSLKLCVSSRPWTEFKDALGGDSKRMLIFQDLTRVDMDRFVRGMLEQDERFEQMAKDEPIAQHFIEEILDKAQGVFLWVFLVVRSLLRGFGQHNDIAILEKRLSELPSELEGYFARILNSIEDVYQDHAARMFHLMVRAAPLPLTAFWYLPREMEDPDYVLKRLNMVPITDAEAEKQKIKAEHSINAWCRDLLEVRTERPDLADSTEDVAFLRHRVDFLHRTVRDFLLLKDIQDMLDAHIKSEFSPWLSLVRVHLFEAKSLSNRTDGIFQMRHFVNVAREVMLCARKCEIHTSASPVALVDELDRVGCHFREMARTESGQTLWHWTRASSPRHESFMTYAMSFELTLYIRQTFAQTPRELELAAPSTLLGFAFKNRIEHESTGESYMPSLAVVQALLDSGADPNHDSRLRKADVHSPTPWEHFLRRCHREKLVTLWPIARLLLLSGAHANDRVPVDRSSRVYPNPEWKSEDTGGYADARECLVRCCPPEKVDEMDQLLREASVKEPTLWSRIVNIWKS